MCRPCCRGRSSTLAAELRRKPPLRSLPSRSPNVAAAVTREAAVEAEAAVEVGARVQDLRS